MIEQERYRWLIDPVPPAEFEESYYGRRACVVRRNDRHYFDGLLSLGDLDGILGAQHLKHPDVQVVKHETDIKAGTYTDGTGRIDPVRAARLFGDGATLVFSHLHQRVPALAALCHDLGQVFSSKFQANVYLTPPHAQGFPIHWDTHDVFVVQTEGSKRWCLYDTKIPHPLIGQGFNHERDEPGPLSDEFELQAGDLAYVPRGLMHAAHATDQHSLHVTVGVMAFTWTDALLESVAAAALKEASLRESLPVGFARSDFPAGQRREALKQRLRALLDHVDAEAVFERLGLQLDPPIADGSMLLRKALSPPSLDRSSAFSRRPGAWSLACDDGGCLITTAETGIQFPAVAEPLLRLVEQRERFGFADLPDVVDDQGKMTVMKHLIRHGILTVDA